MTTTQLVLTAERTVVAVVFNEDGTIHDRCHSWESGQTYANAGYEVQAVNDDGHVTKEVAQSMYDRERELAADCFGPGIRENY